MNIQQLVDDKSYPPTMTYDVRTLIPDSVLKQRMDIIKREFPFFFEGDSLLDIGCSKGYFSFAHNDKFCNTLAFDSDEDVIGICKTIQETRQAHSISSLLFECDTFRDIELLNRYDKIFVGNVLHHIYNDCNGWGFIKKLAAVSSGQVLMEMALDMDCPDMPGCIREELQPRYTEEIFREVIQDYFKIIKIVPSVSYTPSRYFVLLDRINQPPFILEDQITKQRDIKSIQKSVYVGLLEDEVVVVKRNRLIYHVDTLLASFVGKTTPVLGLIPGYGHVEKFVDNSLYEYFENQEVLIRRHIRDNIELSRIGYFNLDSAAINYFKDDTAFDKCCVVPISRTDEIRNSGYLTMFKNSYRPKHHWISVKIQQALETKNSHRIEEVLCGLASLLGA